MIDTICPLLERMLAGEAHAFTIHRQPGGADGVPTIAIQFKLRTTRPWRFQIRFQQVLRRLNAGSLGRFWPDLDFTRPFNATLWTVDATVHDFGRWQR